MRLPMATAVLHPCKEAALFGVVPQMARRVAWVEKRKENYEGNEGDEGVKMKSMFLLSPLAVF
jgi:hypothetical protein